MDLGLIVHQFPPKIGGSERYAEVLAGKLHDRGHRVTVYTTRHPDRDPGEFPYEIRSFSNCVPKGFGYFAWPGVLTPTDLRGLGDHDAVHAVAADMFSAVVGAGIRRGYGTPALLTTFYHPPRTQGHPRMKRAYDRIVLQSVLEQYDRLLVSSAFERDQLARNFDLTDVRLREMRIPSTAEAPPSGNFREQLGLTDEFLLLYVGRLDSHKGMATLLPAVDRLAEEIPSLRCVVVGETERWHEWPDRVERVVDANSERFVFTGVRTGGDLTAVYEAADVFVFPSEYETYGLVTVEALSHGTPVVATPVGIAPELIDGSNGHLYDIGDADALVARIRDIWESDATALHANAKASVASLSWETTLSELERLYRGDHRTK